MHAILFIFSSFKFFFALYKINFLLNFIIDSPHSDASNWLKKIKSYDNDLSATRAGFFHRLDVIFISVSNFINNLMIEPFLCELAKVAIIGAKTLRESIVLAKTNRIMLNQFCCDSWSSV